MRDLRFGLAFLTRLPGPPGAPTDRELGASVVGWPLAGVVVGAAQLMALVLGSWLISPGVGAVAAVAAGLWVTRGFHLDGLSDCADGLLCPGDPQRRLEVMHDPHVGALASGWVTVALAAKVALVLAVVQQGTSIPALLLAPLLARFPLALEVHLGAPATPTGLFANLHHRVTPADASRATMVGVVLLIALLPFTPPLALSVGLALALLVTVGWHRLWADRIGGLNGDVLGAAVELRELCVLGALATPHWL